MNDPLNNSTKLY